ncbi:MAG: three-Cys-motif partner protein TcmP [Candidatus Latescibacteria bacterium]|nr:three-Cys-motif partner protein TcmP [Candidatus Latescibacterota bacterium]
MNFNWHPDERPPIIDPHSKAKLDVLRNYLRAYFDRLNVNPSREEFKIDLVDGFAGGGTFRNDEKIVSGTPLIMLEEANAATDRLNENRTKPLRFDYKCYFIEKEATHADHLRKVLSERSYALDDGKIAVRNCLFEDEVEDILTAIKHRQPRAGRAIFLLDQTGFSQVKLTIVAEILRELPAAEVILTFAAEALTNYLANTPQMIAMVAPLELTKSQIQDLIQLKNGNAGRALVQRTLREQIRLVTGATYDTPFFIRPKESRRALWFLHLSKHPTARDVMIQVHWAIQNTFEHYGSGDFGMLGWDTLRDPGTVPLFNFNEMDQEIMRTQLLDTLPRELFSLASEEPVTIDAMRHRFANRTAARYSDLDSIVLQLFREGEIEILGANDRVRSASLQNLRAIDRIVMPKQTRIFFDDLRRDSK